MKKHEKQGILSFILTSLLSLGTFSLMVYGIVKMNYWAGFGLVLFMTSVLIWVSARFSVETQVQKTGTRDRFIEQKIKYSGVA